ncbi:MAG: hypothetical protein COA84_03560 [Robiginitomaculum sp.]|nr:MAG: hypothetical protein COA84_03560 [Robiginitomaculum sp.]
MIRLKQRLILAVTVCVMRMALVCHNKNALMTGLILLFCLCLFTPAFAAAPVTLEGKIGEGYARILFTWPENKTDEKLVLNAHIKNGVLIASFNQPFTANAKPLLSDLKAVIALARMDPDGQTVRIALRGKRDVRTSRSYNVFALDLIEPESQASPPPVLSPRAIELRQMSEEQRQAALLAERAKTAPKKPPLAIPLKVRAAETSDYTRIAFDWTQPVGHSLTIKGNVAELVFDRPAVPDLTELNVDTPQGLLQASSHTLNGKTIVKIELAPGIQARLWEDNARVLVDLFKPEQDNPEPLASPAQASHDKLETQIPEPTVKSTAYVDPSPGNGIIRAKVSRIGTDMQVTFDFAAPVGSAAFRRGENIWILFDDNAAFDLSELEHSGSQHIRGFQSFQSTSSSGVRFEVPASTQVEAQASNGGAHWVFAFGEKLNIPPRKLKLYREADGSGPGRLIADLPNVTNIHLVDDPVIGDQLSIATALGPITGVQSRRQYVDVTALPSSQGLAFEINADGVIFEKEANRVIVRTKEGLYLTPSARSLQRASKNHAKSSQALSARSATPGFIDFAGWAKPDPSLGFNANYDAVLRRVAAEETDPQTHIALARFLVANSMAPEALGMLELAQRLDPSLVQEGEFRALRGAANVLFSRTKDARADFAAQTLNRDPSAALWRGYLAAQMEDWGPARREFDAGREAFYLLVPEWQARFRNAYARSALALNDLGAARRQLDEAMAIDTELPIRMTTRMIRASYAEVSGDTQKAIRYYQIVADSGYEPLETQALFNITRLRTEAGEMKPVQAANILENLRYRWRGDNTELEEVLALGKIYGELGDYNRALKAMNTAVMRFPDSPVTRRISDDMHKIFNDLFLHGGADSMDPVQALALFYQFIDMVPIGAEGDRMLRLLADRLVDFDLLPQATELLQHQVDNRIRSGQARAQIAAKLALIYLMDRKPEKALNAIRGTRQARLPKDLNQQRRLIEARALIALGRTDHALELIENDRTRGAAILRANIAWQSKNWPLAGPTMLNVAQRHMARLNTLGEENASLILRTAIALSLSKNWDGLERLRKTFAKAMSQTEERETFDLVTQRKPLGDVPVKDLAPMLAETESLRATLKRYQERFENIEVSENTRKAAGRL